MGETIRPTRPLVVMALLLTIFGLTGCMSEPSGLPSAEPRETSPDSAGAAIGNNVAFVGGRPIAREELLAKLLSSYGAETLKGMMLHAAVELEAKAWGLQVTDEELEHELRRMSEGYESEEQYYSAMMEQLGMDRQAVREDARDRLLLEKLAVREVTVMKDEIERYRSEHAAEFGPRNQLQLAQIVLEDRKTADSVVDQLAGGADFAAMAARYSIDELTADSGGDLGWLDENDPFEDPAVMKTARELSVGETAGPIETENGYAIVQLLGKNTLEAMDPSAAEEQIRRAIALEKGTPIQALEQLLLEKYEAEVLDPDLRP